MPTPSSCKVHLASGPELKIMVERFSPPVHRWMAVLSLTVSFDATDVEEAEGKGVAAMMPVLERALSDLRAKLSGG